MKKDSKLIVDDSRGHDDLDRPVGQINIDEFNAFLDTSAFVVVKISAEEKITKYNPTLAKIFDRDLIGSSIYDIIDQEYTEIVRTKHQAIFSKHSVQRYELSFTNTEGIRRYFNASAAPVKDDDAVYAVLIIAQDITEQKLYENTLVESEERYRRLAELTFEGILLHDNGTIVDCNETFLRLFEYTREEVIGKYIFDLLVSDDAKAKIYHQFQNENPLPQEFEGIAKNGRTLQVELQSRAVNYQGKMLRAIVLRDISDKIRTEGELSMLYAAIEQSSSSIVITDPKGQIEYVNPAFSTNSGYTMEEVKGKNPRILKTDWHDGDYYKDLWTSVLSGKTWYGEFRNRKKSGEIYWESAVISPVMNKNNEITHILAIKDNTTEQKRAEKALKKSEERHRIISELISDYAYRMDLRESGLYKLNWTSGAFQKISGYTVDEINQKPNHWMSIIHRDDISRIKNVFGDIGRETFLNVEYRILTKDGEEKWLSDHGRPIWDENRNEVLGILGAVQDITLRKNAEQALITSERNMNLLLKTIPDLIFVLDREGRFLEYYTDGKERLLIPPENFMHKHFHEVFPPSMSKEFYYYLEKAFESRELQAYEYVLKKDGKTYFNESRLIVSGENEVVAVIRDITDLKKAATELEQAKTAAEQANKAKSAFLANMSHEIRTPINAVLGFSDLLHSLLEDPVQKGYLKSIMSSGNTLLTLLNDILDLSKIEAGKMSIKPIPVDIKAIFEEISHIFSLKSREKGLDLITEVSDTLPSKAFIDELRLRQILLNLVDNAIKFTEQGYVKVSAKMLSRKKSKKITYGNIMISVADTGIGIGAEDKKKIFRAFVQKDDQDKRKYGGTGLGLAITKRLTEMMGGIISVESEPGQGATFSIIFDKVRILDDGQYTLELEEDRKIEKIQMDHLSVVIVESDENNCRLMKEVFAGPDVGFQIFTSMKDFEMECKAMRPDLLLISLPDTDPEIIKRMEVIRKLPNLSDVPAIIITSFDDPTMIAGISDWKQVVCLSKPIDLRTLTERANYLLRLKSIAESGLQEDQHGSVHKKETNLELIDLLDTKYMRMWSNTKSAASFSSIERFATKLAHLGKEYDEKEIIRYGEDLSLYTRNFDIDNIHNLLNRFPEMVELLKKTENT